MIWVIIQVLFGVIVGGVAFRLRGGGFITFGYTSAARLVYAALLAAVPAVLTLDYHWVVILPALFCGTALGWFNSADAGRVEGQVWRDRGILLLRGLWWTLPTLPVFYWPWNGHGWLGLLPGAWWWALIGLACPIAYEIGWRTKWRSEGAEVLFGAILGGSLAYALV